MVLTLTLVLGLMQVGLAQTPVAIDSGLISGSMTEEGIRVFKGIPFAAPTEGLNRWRPPQPVEPWSGVRACDTYGAACPQSDILARRYKITLPPMSEDCLTLDVYAPTPSNQPYPVMVWIHGGGFATGHSSSYNGQHLARLGVVVVCINYRLGVFGFLPHALLTEESEPHSSGNYGLLDQIAALQWVQRNIAALGGDPGNVTIFGQSSGGTAVCTLMTSPLAQGLFHRAIAQSNGAYDILPDLATAEGHGKQLFVAMQTDQEIDPLTAMRNEPWQAIMKGTQTARVRYSVIQDGWCVPVQPIEVFKRGEQINVPLLIGSNANESDEEFTVAARFFAREHSKLNPHTYRYCFSLGSDQGHAIHAAEIDYVFNAIVRREGSIFAPLDRQLAQTISRLWVQFASTGTPNSSGQGLWPAYNAQTDPYLDFGATVSMKNQFRSQLCDEIEKKTTPN